MTTHDGFPRSERSDFPTKFVASGVRVSDQCRRRLLVLGRECLSAAIALRSLVFLSGLSFAVLVIVMVLLIALIFRIGGALILVADSQASPMPL